MPSLSLQLLFSPLCPSLPPPLPLHFISLCVCARLCMCVCVCLLPALSSLKQVLYNSKLIRRRRCAVFTAKPLVACQGLTHSLLADTLTYTQKHTHTQTNARAHSHREKSHLGKARSHGSMCKYVCVKREILSDWPWSWLQWWFYMTINPISLAFTCSVYLCVDFQLPYTGCIKKNRLILKGCLFVVFTRGT